MTTSVELDLSFHPRQLQAFHSEATELLFGGASEGGKSAFIRRALCRWCVETGGLQCVLVRKKYQDILLNHVRGPDGFRKLLEPLIKLKLVKITNEDIQFWNGSLITFQHCQDERQLTSAQGVEKHVLVIDEATQISERLIQFFRGWVRMSKEFQDTLPKQYRGKFPKIIYTANPIGASLGWFRRNFVLARPTFAIEKVQGFLRQYIPSRITDNPSADVEAQRGRLSAFDANTARALIEGDWNAPMGDFFPEWDESRHVIADSIIPEHWFRFRTFDWGSGEPFAIHWWAFSDGATLGGKYIPRGSLVCYREWYGCQEDDPAKGIHMRNEEIGSGILQRTEPTFWSQPTLADRWPFNDIDGSGEGTIAKKIREGSGGKIRLTRANDSRVAGWSQLRSRLIGITLDKSENTRYPLIYVMESCRYMRDYLPALPRHPAEGKAREDAAEHGEATHCADGARYASMAHTIIKDYDAPIEVKTQKTLQAKPVFRDMIDDGHEIFD